jgi:hypothetical protein
VSGVKKLCIIAEGGLEGHVPQIEYNSVEHNFLMKEPTFIMLGVFSTMMSVKMERGENSLRDYELMKLIQD